MSSEAVSKVVLITGCSSGIGRATALRLSEAGWTVYATARRVGSIADLAEAGCRTLALDVTDEASMREAVELVEARHGAIGVLINNAGYSESGAIEEISTERLRRQFETNVFGVHRLVQLVLPGMRRQEFSEQEAAPRAHHASSALIWRAFCQVQSPQVAMHRKTA